MPRESLDAPENLPKERRCQMAFGQLQDEYRACRMRRRPVLNSRFGHIDQKPHFRPNLVGHDCMNVFIELCTPPKVT